MRKLWIVAGVFAGLTSPALFAQTTVKPATMADFADQPVVFQNLDVTYRMNADGTGESETRSVMRIQSGAAAQKFSVLSFNYASATQTPAQVANLTS